jgi:hypothetical protein
VAGRARRDQHRPGRLEPLDRLAVAGLDPLVAVGRDQQPDVLGLAVGGRAPVDLLDRDGLLAEGVGHQVEARGCDT